jgi:hypothetical protein
MVLKPTTALNQTITHPSLTRERFVIFMATFVIQIPEKNQKSIMRNGITRLLKRGGGSVGVYTSLVTKDYHALHQWLRELKLRILAQRSVEPH